MTVIPTRNGFVDTVILAYSKHHALVLRPDDSFSARVSSPTRERASSRSSQKARGTHLTSATCRARCGKTGLVLDQIPFHQMDCDNMPPSYAEVDVKLDDNGEIFDCTLTAGLVGTRISSSNDTKLSATGENDTVRPLLGWWMFIKKEEE
ncbi:hypothetical protein C8R44DRAFT_948583 [Mycena epipterygia]|nr:hypothetical protein C8R44DRAFT_948583 [Mycena epipterygia]